MKQNGTSGSTTGRLFVLVGPTAVVSQCLPPKQVWFGSCGRRVVDQHDQYLSAIVCRISLVVVPVLFWCVDTIANEDQICIDVRFVGLRSREGNVIICELECFTAGISCDR